MTQQEASASEAAAKAGDVIQCSVSDDFARWISQAAGSVAITTYQAGKVAMVGWDGRQVTLLMRQFDKPMGLAVRGHSLALATRRSVHFLANAPLLAGDYLPEQPGRYDALYLPRTTYHTGDLSTHDLAFDSDGLWVVNTRFSCLCSLSDDFSFVPRWKPSFISELAPEDRCHLNGLAMVDGRPRYVTALGRTDTAGAWRQTKATGGVVLDVTSDEVVAQGLAMPHSPRWHEGRLWVLNSGLGELCEVDLTNGKLTTVCALPGYLRGLSFAGPYALVGLCQIREKHTFGGLPIQQRHRDLLCAVAVVDLRSGKPCGMLQFTAGCQELYDVQFLPAVRRPMILNLERDAVHQALTAPEFAYWLRPATGDGPSAPAAPSRGG